MIPDGGLIAAVVRVVERARQEPFTVSVTDPRDRSDHDVLIDGDSIRELAARSGVTMDMVPVGIVAIVAPNDILFGLSRMWAGLAPASNLVVHVGRTREEATTWLAEELRQRDLPFQLA